jgi:hypothetical protein
MGDNKCYDCGCELTASKHHAFVCDECFIDRRDCKQQVKQVTVESLPRPPTNLNATIRDVGLNLSRTRLGRKEKYPNPGVIVDGVFSPLEFGVEQILELNGVPVTDIKCARRHLLSINKRTTKPEHVLYGMHFGITYGDNSTFWIRRTIKRVVKRANPPTLSQRIFRIFRGDELQPRAN